MDERALITRIDALQAQVASLQRSSAIKDHSHDGYDASRIVFENIDRSKFYVNHTIIGAAAATAANYGVFMIVLTPCTLTGVKEVHQVIGSDGSAVTVTLEKLTGVQAPDAGNVCLTAALSLKATANTVQSGSITTVAADRTFTVGDRLCLKDAGTLTSVSNVTFSLEFTYLR